MAIVVSLDLELVRRRMTLTELAERVGITPVNLSILKNNRAKAIRFSTLDAICRELACFGTQRPASAEKITSASGCAAGLAQSSKAARSKANPRSRMARSSHCCTLL